MVENLNRIENVFSILMPFDNIFHAVGISREYYLLLQMNRPNESNIEEKRERKTRTGVNKSWKCTLQWNKRPEKETCRNGKDILQSIKLDNRRCK